MSEKSASAAETKRPLEALSAARRPHHDDQFESVASRVP
jgi:hypothetical protein